MVDDVKKPYHHGDLREKLLDAAEQALAELPLPDVSLREIARRAGVSHAAPKHHFATLGDLLGETAARGFERFVAHLDFSADRFNDQTPVGRLTAMGRAYLRFAESNPAVYGLMFGNKCAMTPHMTEAAITAWTQLETACAAIVGQQKSTEAAVMVWSSVHGLSMLLLEQRLPPHISPNVAIEDVTRMMINGLKAE